MATHSDVTTPNTPQVPLVPPLESGDCMSRAEFERRYEALPGLKKAELVEGVVFVPSPTSDSHARDHAHITTWLNLYALQTRDVACRANATVRLDLKSEVQPDALLLIERGGQTKIGPSDYIEGPPELAAEVASSSVSRDLHSKLDLYRRHGVQEYFVWRILDNEVDWFRLVGGEYQQLQPDVQGIVRSQIFPGLWLDKPALLRGEMTAVLATLQQGLASPEHAAFAVR
jgi:Uma2 family endonuclease